jgi:hypothetical protein
MHQAGYWKKQNWKYYYTIYYVLYYTDTGHFFGRTSATLFTDSAGDVTTSDGNNKME